MKLINFDKESRQHLSEGVKLLSKAVKTTLGPSGRTVLIKSSFEGDAFSTKDGVTVAANVESSNPFEMIAIDAMREVAKNADNLAGDGTTTATILAEAIFLEALQYADSSNLIMIKKGIEEAARIIVDEIKNNKTDCTGNSEILREVAMISSNYDEVISDVVLRAFEVSGDQGVVNIQRSRTSETFLKQIDGMVLPGGFMSTTYINNKEAAACEFVEPFVLITNRKIDGSNDDYLGRIIEILGEHHLPLVIICNEIQDDIFEHINLGVQKKAIQVCICKGPEFGNEQAETMKDLSVVLGIDGFMEDEGVNTNDLVIETLDDVIKYIPRADSMFITQKSITLKKEPNDEEHKTTIKNRADRLREEVKTLNTSYEKARIQTRISRLTNGVAYINIGAMSDIEFTEKQHRIQDSLYAVKYANEEGIIPGGGSLLFKLSFMPFSSKSLNPDVHLGAEILLKALREPLLQIARNVGHEFTDKEINMIHDIKDFGYNAVSNQVENMMDAKIYDPVKVVRSSIENAVSIAAMLLTTECVIVNEKAYSHTVNPFGYAN